MVICITLKKHDVTYYHGFPDVKDVIQQAKNLAPFQASLIENFDTVEIAMCELP